MRKTSGRKKLLLCFKFASFMHEEEGETCKGGSWRQAEAFNGESCIKLFLRYMPKGKD
jgi:hypothetical protein